MGVHSSLLNGDWRWDGRYILVASGACLISVIGLATVGIKRWRTRLELDGERDRASMNKRDLVYLIIPARIGVVPSISPFVIKLETWFRMVGVPYEVVESRLPSSKKTYPYIYLNGEEIPDSNFIVKRVSAHFNIVVDEKLTDEGRGVSVAFTRMLEENTFLTYIWYRYVSASNAYWALFSPVEKLGSFGRQMLYHQDLIKQNACQKSWWHGMGRHSPAEVFSIAETDLKAVSAYLGDKDYLVGKEPTLVDCVLFGHLVQILLLKINFPPEKFALNQCGNLVQFVERMKEQFYPDWDQLCQPSG